MEQGCRPHALPCELARERVLEHSLAAGLCAANINYLLTTLQAVIRHCCWQLFPKPTRGTTGGRSCPCPERRNGPCEQV